MQEKDRDCGDNGQRDEDEHRDSHANRDAVGKRGLTGWDSREPREPFVEFHSMPSFRVRPTLCQARIGQIRIRRPFSNDSTVRPLSQPLALDGFDTRPRFTSWCAHSERRYIEASPGYRTVCDPCLPSVGNSILRSVTSWDCLQCMGRSTNAVQYPLGLACCRCLVHDPIRSNPASDSRQGWHCPCTR